MSDKMQRGLKLSKARIAEIRKKMILSCHEPGEPCNCKRWECYDHVSPLERKEIIKNFNNLSNINEQNVYLSSLITILPVKRRRPRRDAEHFNRSVFHDCSFKFVVKVKRNKKIIEVPVCKKAFMSIHGISSGKVEYIQKSLRLTGEAPIDKRGTHKNHERNKEAKEKILSHVETFNGLERQDSNGCKILYLPPELNIKKMFTLFNELYPDLHVTYEYYRSISKKHFNITFACPTS